MSPLVLIVEDDDLIGPSLQRALVASGYRAERVGDGATALPRVRDGAVDLVLLDLGLPDTDGSTSPGRCSRPGPGCRSSCSPPAPRRPTS